MLDDLITPTERLIGVIQRMGDPLHFSSRMIAKPMHMRVPRVPPLSDAYNPFRSFRPPGPQDYDYGIARWNDPNDMIIKEAKLSIAYEESQRRAGAAGPPAVNPEVFAVVPDPMSAGVTLDGTNPGLYIWGPPPPDLFF